MAPIGLGAKPPNTTSPTGQSTLDAYRDSLVFPFTESPLLTLHRLEQKNVDPDV